MSNQIARKPVVFFHNGLGDYLLGLPAMRALSSIFSDSLTVVCGSKQTILDELSSARIIKIQITETPTGKTFDPVDFANKVGYCDLFITLNPWHSEEVDKVIELLRPKATIGYFNSFDRKVPDCRGDKHAMKRAFALPQMLNNQLQVSEFVQPMHLPSSNDEDAKRLRSLIPSCLHVLSMHFETQDEKSWSVDNIVKFLDLFLDLHKDFVVMLVGLKEMDLAACRHQTRIYPCFGLPLNTSFGVIKYSQLFIGVDSCMLHAADSFRIPGIGLFGPTDPEEFGFRLTRHRHVSAQGSMNLISVQDVLSQVESLRLEANQGN